MRISSYIDYANTPGGAKASAITYSLVETAKENGLNPYLYLEYLFAQLPNVQMDDPDVIEDLLPWSDKLPEGIQSSRKK